jgi:hypothetical protein
MWDKVTSLVPGLMLAALLVWAGWLCGIAGAGRSTVAAIRADLSEQGCVLTWQDEGDGAHWRVWCEEAQQ